MYANVKVIFFYQCIISEELLNLLKFFRKPMKVKNKLVWISEKLKERETHTQNLLEYMCVYLWYDFFKNPINYKGKIRCVHSLSIGKVLQY